MKEEGAAVRVAVAKAIEEGVVTEDLAEGGKSYSTKEVGDFIAKSI